jgi:hypothetical protein
MKPILIVTESAFFSLLTYVRGDLAVLRQLEMEECLC